MEIKYTQNNEQREVAGGLKALIDEADRYIFRIGVTVLGMPFHAFSRMLRFTSERIDYILEKFGYEYTGNLTTYDILSEVGGHRPISLSELQNLLYGMTEEQVKSVYSKTTEELLNDCSDGVLVPLVSEDVDSLPDLIFISKKDLEKKVVLELPGEKHG